MVSGTIHTVRENESNVVSGVSNDPSISGTDNSLSLDGKERKAEAIYLSGQWKDKDEYEITKLRQVVCNHIFRHSKFVKGEGNIPCAKRDRKSQKKHQLLFGMCHERPDLTKQTGYEYKML